MAKKNELRKVRIVLSLPGHEKVVVPSEMGDQIDQRLIFVLASALRRGVINHSSNSRRVLSFTCTVGVPIKVKRAHGPAGRGPKDHQRLHMARHCHVTAWENLRPVRVGYWRVRVRVGILLPVKKPYPSRGYCGYQ